MSTVDIPIKLLNENAKLPTRGSDDAAGYDLYSAEYAMIFPGTTVVIGTGLAMAIPEGKFGAIFARSGLATKEGLRPANCVGVIDSDYRGEIKVALHNDNISGDLKTLEIGTRIAQLVILDYNPVTFTEVKDGDLPVTNRNTGGFGSTGMN